MQPFDSTRPLLLDAKQEYGAKVGTLVEVGESGEQTGKSSQARQMNHGFKRQLTDKYSAEKIKNKAQLATSDRVDEVSQDKTRLSFPSDFSQVVSNKKRNTTTGGFPTFRRSGTCKEKQERFK